MVLGRYGDYHTVYGKSVFTISEVISDDEFRVKYTIKVAFKGHPYDLCPICYQKFRDIRSHYDNLFNAEIKEWLGRG